MTQYRSIQYLRGIAAMMVVYFHFLMHLERNGTGMLPDGIKLGAAGVDIFFVISGFIMWVTTYDAGVRPPAFWVKRLIRIVPLYWSYTLLLAALAIVAPAATRTQLDLGHLMASLSFIPVYHPYKDGNIWPLLVPGWSLNFEMYFYLIFGGCLILGRHIRLWALTGIFSAAFVAGQLWEFVDPAAITYTSPVILEFLMGVIIGEMMLNGRIVRPPIAILLSILAGSFFVMNSYSEPEVFDRLLLWGAPSALLVYAFVSLEKRGWQFENRTMLALGKSSYSLYLSHMFTLGAIGFVWAKVGVISLYLDLAMHPLALGVSGIVGFILHQYYETPLLRTMRRIILLGSTIARTHRVESRADRQ